MTIRANSFLQGDFNTTGGVFFSQGGGKILPVELKFNTEYLLPGLKMNIKRRLGLFEILLPQKVS